VWFLSGPLSPLFLAQSKIDSYESFLLFYFVEFSCSWNQQLFFLFCLGGCISRPSLKRTIVFPFFSSLSLMSFSSSK
jgi:hypothetical protein